METNMPILYEHTQRGTLMIALPLGGALVAGATAYCSAGSARAMSAVIALGLVIAAWLFSSLTVIVENGELRWHFGPGFLNYRMALTDIATASAVRNRWFYGFGIRMAPGFRLYNVSGLDAVELKLKNGEIRRIGTDDPNGLASALKAN
jgi:hypothetical protein